MLVRHAPAAPEDSDVWPDDEARPLTKRGIRKFKDAATGLGKLVMVRRVLVSQYARCLQTASLLEWDAGWPAAVAYDIFDDPFTPEQILKDIRALDEWPCALGLVGHNPNLLALLEYLLPASEDDSTSKIELKNGSATLVRIGAKLTPHTGTLVWCKSMKELSKSA